MTKTEAIRLLGHSVSDAAKALGITPSAISQWPEELTRSMEDRVLAHLARTHGLATAVRQPSAEGAR